MHWIETPPSGHEASQVPVPPLMQHVWPLGHPLMMQAGIMKPPSPPLLLPDPLLLPVVDPLLLLLPLPLPLPLLLPPSPPFELVEPPQATTRATEPPNQKPRRLRTSFMGNLPPRRSADEPYRSEPGCLSHVRRPFALFFSIPNGIYAGAAQTRPHVRGATS